MDWRAIGPAPTPAYRLHLDIVFPTQQSFSLAVESSRVITGNLSNTTEELAQEFGLNASGAATLRASLTRQLAAIPQPDRGSNKPEEREDCVNLDALSSPVSSFSSSPTFLPIVEATEDEAILIESARKRAEDRQSEAKTPRAMKKKKTKKRSRDEVEVKAQMVSSSNDVRPILRAEHHRSRFSSSYRGVSLAKRSSATAVRPWQAQIALGGRSIYLGCYETEWEAGVAYAREYMCSRGASSSP